MWVCPSATPPSCLSCLAPSLPFHLGHHLLLGWGTFGPAAGFPLELCSGCGPASFRGLVCIC